MVNYDMSLQHEDWRTGDQMHNLFIFKKFFIHSWNHTNTVKQEALISICMVNNILSEQRFWSWVTYTLLNITPTHSQGLVWTQVIHGKNCCHNKTSLKGALDNFSLIPIFFPKSWDFYINRSVYLCSDCMLNITCSMNSITKIMLFFQQPFLKVNF